jgi:hypothetical protein
MEKPYLAFCGAHFYPRGGCWLYPIDWRELSAVIRFERAGSRCEQCGCPYGETVLHLGDGRWWDEAAQTWRTGRWQKLKHGPRGTEQLRATRVVLAAAHLNHDPTNNHPRNLKALCQRCHMLYDREEHLRRRAITYLARRALGDLFSGPYRAF